MARSGPTIVYRHNPPILGLRPLGPKVQDAVTGFWYPKAFQTTNDFGDLVDSRGEGMDVKDDRTNIRSG